MTGGQLLTLQIMQIMSFSIIFFEFENMTKPWKKGFKGKALVVGRFFFFMIPSLIMISLSLRPF